MYILSICIYYFFFVYVYIIYLSIYIYTYTYLLFNEIYKLIHLEVKFVAFQHATVLGPFVFGPGSSDSHDVHGFSWHDLEALLAERTDLELGAPDGWLPKRGKVWKGRSDHGGDICYNLVSISHGWGTYRNFP